MLCLEKETSRRLPSRAGDRSTSKTTRCAFLRRRKKHRETPRVSPPVLFSGIISRRFRERWMCACDENFRAQSGHFKISSHARAGCARSLTVSENTHTLVKGAVSFFLLLSLSLSLSRLRVVSRDGLSRDARALRLLPKTETLKKKSSRGVSGVFFRWYSFDPARMAPLHVNIAVVAVSLSSHTHTRRRQKRRLFCDIYRKSVQGAAA